MKRTFLLAATSEPRLEQVSTQPQGGKVFPVSHEGLGSRKNFISCPCRAYGFVRPDEFYSFR